MISLVLFVLAHLPPGVEARTMSMNRSIECPRPSSDAPGILEVQSGHQNHPVCVGRTPGMTTCTCAMRTGVRTVWQMTGLGELQAKAKDVPTPVKKSA